MQDAVVGGVLGEVSNWKCEIIQAVFDVEQPMERASLSRTGFNRFTILHQMCIDFYGPAPPVPPQVAPSLTIDQPFSAVPMSGQRFGLDPI